MLWWGQPSGGRVVVPCSGSRLSLVVAVLCFTWLCVYFVFRRVADAGVATTSVASCPGTCANNPYFAAIQMRPTTACMMVSISAKKAVTEMW